MNGKKEVEVIDYSGDDDASHIDFLVDLEVAALEPESVSAPSPLSLTNLKTIKMDAYASMEPERFNTPTESPSEKGMTRSMQVDDLLENLEYVEAQVPPVRRGLKLVEVENGKFETAPPTRIASTEASLIVLSTPPSPPSSPMTFRDVPRWTIALPIIIGVLALGLLISLLSLRDFTATPPTNIPPTLKPEVPALTPSSSTTLPPPVLVVVPPVVVKTFTRCHFYNSDRPVGNDGRPIVTCDEGTFTATATWKGSGVMQFSEFTSY